MKKRYESVAYGGMDHGRKRVSLPTSWATVGGAFRRLCAAKRRLGRGLWPRHWGTINAFFPPAEARRRRASAGEQQEKAGTQSPWRPGP